MQLVWQPGLLTSEQQHDAETPPLQKVLQRCLLAFKAFTIHMLLHEQPPFYLPDLTMGTRLTMLLQPCTHSNNCHYDHKLAQTNSFLQYCEVDSQQPPVGSPYCCLIL